MQEPVCLPLDFNPWISLISKTQTTVEFVKRGRGRPRKHNLPEYVNKREHKMGDHETKEISIDNVEIQRMKEFFKLQLQSLSTTSALESVAEKFEISYNRAYQELSRYF